MTLPPFKNGLRVVRQYCASGIPLWRIDVKRGPNDQFGVDYRGELSADAELEVALSAFGQNGFGPVTPPQVRAFL